MDVNIKKLLFNLTKINFMSGSIISIMLYLILGINVATAFFLGLILYNICYLLKGYTINRYLVNRNITKSSIIVIDSVRIITVVLFSLFFNDNYVMLLCYCLGIAFNYVSLGFAFLRGEKGSE